MSAQTTITLEDKLEAFLSYIRAGRIKAALNKTFPLSQAAEAHRLLADSQVKGNFVLLPWDD